MASNGTIFAQDEEFWNNYLDARPQAPQSLFDRIFAYHAAQNGTFGTAHDAGAGNGPYVPQLRRRFAHVLVSDIVAHNVKLAAERLGHDGLTYRVGRVEEDTGIAPGSVDLVLATNVLHFPDQPAAMAALARQLRPGGTLAAGTFGPARFDDARLQDLWQRISWEGGRALLRKAEDPAQTLRVMARTRDGNVAPLDPALWAPGAQRVHLNFGRRGGEASEDGGIIGMMPPEEAHLCAEPDHVGPADKLVFEDEAGWAFETDLAGVKAHMTSYPFIADNLDAAAFPALFAELDALLAGGRRVRGHWPAKIILATRR